MNKSTNDRRVRKTKLILKKGLAILLSQKSIHEITVKELTDLVDIHRGTFYFHYHDIYDLQEAIQKEIIEEISFIFEINYPVKSQNSPLPVLIAFNEYLAENSEWGQLLLTNNLEFSKNLSLMIQENYLRNWIIQLCGNSDDLEYTCEFIMAGFMAVIKHWLKYNMQISPTVLANKMISMALHGLEISLIE